MKNDMQFQHSFVQLKGLDENHSNYKIRVQLPPFKFNSMLINLNYLITNITITASY